MARVLVVTNPFQEYGIGDRITDPKQIQTILDGEHAHHVVQADHDLPTQEQE